MKILEFKATPGFGKWNRYYPKEAIAHPAKINQYLLRYLILNYTKEGDTVIDPMAGSGSTGVMCALNGRNCIQVELEQKFWNWMEQARKNVEITLQLTSKGKIINICGDSRKLSELLKERKEEISSVIFSPPYANQLSIHKKPSLEGAFKVGHTLKSMKNPGGQLRYTQHYSRSNNNIGNLSMCDIDSVIFSPPFTSSFKHNSQKRENRIERLRKVDEAAVKRGAKWGLCSDEALERLVDRQDLGYGSGKDNIGNLGFDSIIFSPPYANIAKSNQGAIHPHMQGLISKLSGIPVKEFTNDVDRLKEAVRIAQSKIPFSYGDDPNNIGNLPFRMDSGNLPFTDVAIFSPPYTSAGTKADENPDNYIRRAKERHELMKQQGINRPETEPGRYSGSWQNIGNLPFGVDCIVSSPPYHTQKTGGAADENVMAERWDKIARERNWDTWGKTWTTEGRLRGLKSMGSGYSSDKNNIGNIKNFGISTAIFSPPYESSLEGTTRHTKGGIASRDKKLAQTGSLTEIDETISRLREHGRTDNQAGGPYGKSLGHPYSPKEENIGNKKKESYLEAMETVYSECYKILKKDGLMILILKNFIRNKKLISLTNYTIKLCENVGFKLKERLLFKLPQQSFWRVLGKKKWEAEGKEYPKDLFYEHILIFEKN